MSLSPEARARMQEVARTLLAPLEEWIAREGVTDIWLYRGRLVYQDAAEHPTVVQPVPWLSDKWMGDVADSIKAPDGSTADAMRPLLSTVLADGVRVSVAVPPAVAPDRIASVTLRIPQRVARSHQELCGPRFDLYGLLPDRTAAALYMQDAVLCGRRIVVSGETGSGKTTYLRALAALLDVRHRIVLVENVPEIALPEHLNVLAVLFDEEGTDGVSARDLMMLAMREMPYAVVMGEIRSAVVREWVSLLNSGVRCAMATTHASSPRMVRNRFLSLWGQESALAEKLIVDSLDVIVQMHYVAGMGRRITAITASDIKGGAWIANGFSA